MDDYTADQLTSRLTRIAQHMEGTENALASIAKALEAIHKELAQGNGTYLDCLPAITDSLSNMEGLMGTRR